MSTKMKDFILSLIKAAVQGAATAIIVIIGLKIYGVI